MKSTVLAGGALALTLTLTACGSQAAPSAGPVVPAAAPVHAQDAASLVDNTAAAVTANAFIATLTATQKANTVFAFDNATQRAKWSNLPLGLFPRNGMRMGDLSTAQQALVTKLLQTVLSKDGYTKTVGIMNGDEALKASQTTNPLQFGKDNYFISFLGTPSATTPWMLQFGGHHLGLNITIVKNREVMTPSFIGIQPQSYTQGSQTVRPLGNEYDKAFALLNSLSTTNKDTAILDYTVDNLVLGPGEDGKTIPAEGLPASSMTAAQQAALLDLIHEWVGWTDDQDTQLKMDEIKKNLAKTYFAWSGATTSPGKNYYRIQGPTVFIEFAVQNNNQGSTGTSGLDHWHGIVRDFTDDYGVALPR